MGVALARGGDVDEARARAREAASKVRAVALADQDLKQKVSS